MAKRPASSKLTAKPAGIPVQLAPAPVGPGDLADFPDALAYINSLSATRDGIEWNIKVYLTTGTGGRGNTSKPQFLFTVQPEDLPQIEDRLAEIYAPQGGGDFSVQVRADNQLVKNISLSVAPRPGWRPPPPAYMIAAAPINPQADNPPADRMEVFFGRLATLQEQSAQQTRDLIAAIAGKTAPAGPTFLEQLQMFKQMQELLPQGQQQNGMAMFEKGMELAKSIYENSASGGSTTWMDIFREAMSSPVIKEMIGGAVAAAAANGPAALAAPPRFVSPQNPAAVKMIETLLQQAAIPVDPKTVADQIQMQAPQALMMELELQDDIAGYIIHNFPQAAPHRAWLEQVIANIWAEGDANPSPTLAPLPPHAQPIAKPVT